MKKTINRFFAALIACLVASMMFVPMGVVAEDMQNDTEMSESDREYQEYLENYSGLRVICSGKCGDNITWYRDFDDFLRVSGTGELKRDEYGKLPWDYGAREVYIEDGITSIEGDFSNNEYLYLVTIPETVTRINNLTFENSENIYRVAILNPECEIDTSHLVLPDNPIWEYRGADSEYLVDFPRPFIYGKENSAASELADEYDRYFIDIYGERSLDVIKWSIDGNTLTIKGNTLMNHQFFDWFFAKGYIEKIILKDGVRQIGPNAFMYFEKLKEIDVPSSIESIGYFSMTGCTNLEKINISKKFSDLIISNDAFLGTKWLRNIEGPLRIVDNVLIDGHSCTGDVVIPDNVEKIVPCAMNRCKKIKSVYIGDNVKEIGGYAFHECPLLEKVIIMNKDCKMPGGDQPISNATIYGFTGSTADIFAKENDYKFVALDEPPTTTAVTSVTTNTTMTESTSAFTSVTTSTETVTSKSTTESTSASTRKTTSQTTASTSKTTSATTKPRVRTTLPYTETYQYSYTVTMPIMYELEKINSYPTKTVYYEGEDLDLSGISYTVSSFYYWFDDRNGGGKHTFGGYTEKDPEVDPNRAIIKDENNNKYSGADFSKLQAGKYKVGYGFAFPESPGTNRSGFELSYDVVIKPFQSSTTSNTTVTTNTTTTESTSASTSKTTSQTTVSSSSVTITETTKQGTLPSTGYSSVYMVIAGFAVVLMITGGALAVSKRKEE
ncbi:MAG: leucine-rich repeat protein [Ruminococcus sp.]|uniref:leucine-rich repeat protein n=1 Tax=Ruminococcus sp. TaxID=41978 RepID=UPI0025E450BC|nr:leucine-rich repeat protein [Ruminococcus sp.]MCR5600127.1 leucine-rich repeat protein [Ruminococcus sp.]